MGLKQKNAIMHYVLAYVDFGKQKMQQNLYYT